MQLAAYILLTGALSQSAGQREFALPEGQLAALRAARVVRILVEQDYGGAKAIVLPFEEPARLLLQFAGLRISDGDIPSDGLTLRISVAGHALSARYGPSGGLPVYSGARLSGTISLEVAGSPSLTRSFSAEKPPPSSLMVYSQVRISTPSDAPFAEAYLFPGSFLPVLVHTIAEIYGTDPLVDAVLRTDGRFFGWHETIVDERFFNGRPVLLDEVRRTRDERTIARLTSALGERISPSGAATLNALKWEAYGNRVDALMGALRDGREPVRAEAAKALRKVAAAQTFAEIKDPATIPALAGLLNEPLPVLREEGARALGAIGGKQPVEPLIASLKDRDPKVRKASAYALGSIGDARAISPLGLCLGQPAQDSDVRQEALEPLSKLGAVEPLIAALGDGDFLIRYWAAIRLGEKKDNRAIGPLIAALGKATTQDLKTVTARALWSITGQSFGEAPRAWRDWWAKQVK